MKRGKKKSIISKKVNSKSSKKPQSQKSSAKKIKPSVKIIFSVLALGIIAFLIWIFFFRTPTGPLVDDNFSSDDFKREGSELSITENSTTTPTLYVPSSGSSWGSSGTSSGGTTNPPVDSIAGTDSDGGINYFILGTCTDDSNKFSVSDSCLDNKNLREFEYAEYDGKKGCYYVDKYCPSEGSYSCLNGACVAFKAFATETKEYSDFEGHNIYVKGNCTDVHGTKQESCVSEFGVNEWYIDGGYCAMLPIYCKYGCVDGACLRQAATEPTTPQCVQDSDCTNICSNPTYARCLEGSCSCSIPSEPSEDDSLFCEDSDGYNFTNAGYCLEGGDFIRTAKSEDSCLLQNTTVLEYYCSSADKKCYSMMVTCEDLYGTGYSCFEGACIPPKVILEPITTCSQYCQSIERGDFTSGTCKIGRGTGETVCSASSLQYIAGGDYTCSSGFCCCQPAFR